MTMVIRRPGMHTTVQDLGRIGYAAQAVPESGAADPLSLRAGNRILGNPDSAAALEFTLSGPDLVFERDAAICVIGARCPQATAGVGARKRTIRPGVPLAVRAGEPVTLGTTLGGARGYLCVAGGIGVPSVLGSRSTLGVVGLGGHEGRALVAGDQVPLGPSGARDDVRDPGGVGERLAGWLAQVLSRRQIRITEGLDADRFDSDAWGSLSGPFRVSAQSDRVGVRLEGEPVPRPDSGSMLSEGTCIGAVQITGQGQPIVLGVDRPTTGGYPVIASVITADRCILGQLRPGDVVRFERVTREQARSLLRLMEAELSGIVPAVREV